MREASASTSIGRRGGGGDDDDVFAPFPTLFRIRAGEARGFCVVLLCRCVVQPTAVVYFTDITNKNNTPRPRPFFLSFSSGARKCTKCARDEKNC